ncbi:YbgC/FadM family acyl-CoA thioesterase [Novosphingobium sp. FSY-8]|uniref:YbgC/FadM family acyl-CoA thioesterase n=1 Tax=Novosphingobium ovatum TaxID=1908523 RepID=A0ABW9X9F2_9SPHN|nr:YbgC/FadM family acyl-CoA thioesterase [Novosphingobium ovatum]NBC35152.1 YbgC/FadM family acyl-CoA thioesterase [Novosphingobium ovatum]
MSQPPPPPSGALDGPTHLYTVRAFYEDTDLSGVVYHANYLKWFERARSDLLRLLGIDQRAAVEAGEGAYAVAEMTIRYASPAKLDDVVVVRSSVEELGAASCRMRQLAFRGDVLLAQASVRVGFVAPDGRPRRQPAPWRAAFAQFMAAHAATNPS